MKHFPKLRLVRSSALYTGLALVLAIGTFAATVDAAGIFSARKVALTNQNPSATTVGYNFTVTAQSSTTIKRVEFQFGTALGNSTVPSGMTTTGASLNGQPTNLGSGSGWTADVATNGLFKVNNSSNSTAPSAGATINFSSVTNPSCATGSPVSCTFYVRVSSYDTATSGGTLIDQSDIAFPISASSVTVTASVPETMTFALSSTSVSLGTLSSGSVSTGTHTMAVTTNASLGYSISGLSGSTTLTKGTDTIPFIANGGTIVAGTANYGVAYSGAAGHPSGDNNPSTVGVVASSSTPVSAATTTATYKATMSGTTPAGAYISTVSYVATANF